MVSELFLDIGCNFQCTKDSKLKIGKRRPAEDSKTRKQCQESAKLSATADRLQRKQRKRAGQPETPHTESKRRLHKKQKDAPPNPVQPTMPRVNLEPPLPPTLPQENALNLITPATMMVQVGIRVWVPMVYAPVVGGRILAPGLDGEENDELMNSQCDLNTNSCN
eukprot:TRINITY_DN1183_c0_g4_i1.p1 TRINITY_DN1183_c0_g4~~TRINITY_DN1183_c0_g4_i1.p1  ORF type:complete len:165 (+),score=18.91 TRINITY_DN1183_c0_g4_i1:206-700(+)